MTKPGPILFWPSLLLILFSCNHPQQADQLKWKTANTQAQGADQQGNSLSRNSSEMSAGEFVDVQLLDAAEKAGSLSLGHGLHNSLETKGSISIFAMTSLGSAYPYHRIKGSLYNLLDLSLTQDRNIRIGNIPLVTRAEGAPLVGAPQLNHPKDPEQARHYARELFGTSIPVYIETLEGEIEVDTSLYIPTVLAVEGEFQLGAEQAQVGDRITWQPDPRCPTVLLSLLAHSRLPDAPETSGVHFQKEVRNTGEYTFTEKDVGQMPLAIPYSVLYTLHQGIYHQLVGKTSGQAYSVAGFSEVYLDWEKR